MLLKNQTNKERRKEMKIKHKFLKLILAMTLLTQPLISVVSASVADLHRNGQIVNNLSELDDEYLPLVYANDDSQLEGETGEFEHLPIEDLYELLQEYDRIYDENGGFYELVPIEDIIPEEELERVMDELNSEEGYSTVIDWALFNIDGQELPTPRTHVVRHQRFLGTTANSRYFFRHVPGFNQDGNLPPTNNGNGWRMQTWQINIGGVWLRAFCTQPGIASAEPGNDNLPGWNPSTSSNLTAVQRETIGRILMHGYRNVHRPPTSSSENWIFLSGSGSDALLDDAILVTQIMIQEVSAGQWTWQNITSGTRSPINNSGVHGDPWRRLIANIATSSGMVGGPTWNVPQGIGGASFNPRPAVGSTRRMDMYDGIRHDIYFFHRRNNRPQGTSTSSTTANRPIHTLTWSNTHQMYRTEIDDRISSNGSGTLRRFFGNRTSGSLGNGYRFCRGTQTVGVCSPSVTSNRLIIYTTDSSAPAMNSTTDLMAWNPTGNRNQAVGFFVNPQFQNKVVGAMQDTLHAHFRMQVTPRSRPPVQVLKYSNATGGRLAGATIQLCRGSNTNVAGRTEVTSVSSAWCWEVITDGNGVANFPANGSLVNADGNRFEGMMPNRRYRVREIVAPAGYVLPPVAQRTNWVEVGTGGATATRSATFRNDPIMGEINVTKIGNTHDTSIMETTPLPNTRFRLYRQEDNGTWRHIDSLVTDQNGQGTFRNITIEPQPRIFRVYEYDVEAPWILGTPNYQFVTLSSANTNQAIVVRNTTFVNDEAVGRIEVTKYCEVTGMQIEGAIFSIYGHGVNETAMTDPNGMAIFENLPLGRSPHSFRLTEEFVPEPWMLDPTPWYVEIGRDGITTVISVRATEQKNELVRGRVRIEKLGNHIVGFENYTNSNDYIPEVDDERNQTEQPDAYAPLPEKPVTYEQRSYGVLARAWGWFGRLFSSNTDVETETTMVDENTNPPHLISPIEPTPQGGIRWIFEYLLVEGVRFNIYARDNIVLPNGTIYHEAGAFIGYYYTDVDGFIESNSLHLGNYFIREITAPNGWYIHDVEIDFSLVYADQYTAIVFDEVEVENQWMNVEINLLKVGEVFGGHLDFTNTFTNLEGVHFGLFAGVDFEFLSGQKMLVGTLIEDGFTDEEGRLQFNRELPLGTFFVQEIAVGEQYVVDETRHYFVHTGNVQDMPHLEIEVEGLERIYNYFVRGSFEIIKVSRDLPYIPETSDENDENETLDTDFKDINLDDLDTPTPEIDIADLLLAGVHFKLWNLDLDEYVATFITDENGHIFVEGLIFGNYRLTETQTDLRHQLNSDPIYFTINKEHQEHSWTVINYKTNTNILKVDDLGEPLVGAYFQVIEVVTNTVVEEWISTEEAHVILGLRHGEHILRETQAPTGFILGEDIHFIVTDSQETIYIVAENVLDSRVYIATQAHTGNGRNQYFVWGDTITAYDDIEITHINIRPDTPRAFRAYKFIRLNNGETILFYQTNYVEYTVENVPQFMVGVPNRMEFQVSIQIDTSRFPNMAYTFWAETTYHQNDEGEWVEDYRHNFDGTDVNQTLFPIIESKGRLPQTGVRNSGIVWIGILSLTTGTGYAYYHMKYKKTNKHEIKIK